MPALITNRERTTINDYEDPSSNRPRRPARHRRSDRNRECLHALHHHVLRRNLHHDLQLTERRRFRPASTYDER